MTRQEFDEAYDNGYKHGYAAGRSDSDVLDKITVEIKEKSGLVFKPNDYDLIPKSVLMIKTSAVLQIIDKYRGKQNDNNRIN